MEKKNPGKDSKSTRFLIDILKEEALPDHLLSPDSLTRKKREGNQIFNELCYVALIKSILLYRNILAFLDRQREKNLEKSAELDKMRHLPILNEIQQAGLGLKLPNHLTQEQYKKLESTKEKCEWLNTFLTNKINELTGVIEYEEKEIITLRGKINETRQDIANDWQNHFDHHAADPDFELIIVPITAESELPHQAHIKLSKEKYLGLAESVANELRESETPIHEVDDFFKNVLDRFIDNELHEQLSLPHESKNKLIAKILAQGEAKNYIAEYMLRDVSRNSVLVEKFSELCQQQKLLKESVLRKEAAERGLSDIKAIKEMNNSLLENCNRILGITPSPEPRAEKVTAAVNTIIDKGSQLADILTHKANDIQSNLTQDFAQVDAGEKQTNGLLDRLNALRTKTNLALQQNTVEKPSEVINSFNTLANQSQNLLDTVKPTVKVDQTPSQTPSPVSPEPSTPGYKK